MKSVKDVIKNKCVGCGVCSAACPVNAISLEEKDGFYYPAVDTEKCIECGRCVAVCAIDKKCNSKNPDTYGFYIDGEEIKSCASGGAATALAKKMLSDGGVVYGVEYTDEFNNIEFCRITDVSQLSRIQSSKYSETMCPDYNEVKSDLDNGRDVLFIGLPCQIAGLKIFLGKDYDNLMTVALICLGRSSLKLYRAFVQELVKKYNSPIVGMNMRWKRKDWNVSWIKVNFANGKTFRDIFSSNDYGLLSRGVLRPSCYDCQFKVDNAFEDILIGDFWGSEFLSDKYQNKMGISVVMTFNDKADTYVHTIKGSLFNVNYDTALKTNGAISASYVKPQYYDEAIAVINDKIKLSDICKSIYGNKHMILLKIKFMLKYMMPGSIIRKVRKKKHR